MTGVEGNLCIWKKDRMKGVNGVFAHFCFPICMIIKGRSDSMSMLVCKCKHVGCGKGIGIGIGQMHHGGWCCCLRLLRRYTEKTDIGVAIFL